MKIKNIEDANKPKEIKHEIGGVYVDGSNTLYLLCFDERDGAFFFVDVATGEKAAAYYESLSEVDIENPDDKPVDCVLTIL